MSQRLEFLNNISTIVVSGWNRINFCEDLGKLTLYLIAQKRAVVQMINYNLWPFFDNLRVDSSTLISLVCPADVINSFSVRYSESTLKRKQGLNNKDFHFLSDEEESFHSVLFQSSPQQQSLCIIRRCNPEVTRTIASRFTASCKGSYCGLFGLRAVFG